MCCPLILNVARFVRTIGTFEIYVYACGKLVADLFCKMGRQGLQWKAFQDGTMTMLNFNIAEGTPLGQCQIELSCDE